MPFRAPGKTCEGAENREWKVKWKLGVCIDPLKWIEYGVYWDLIVLPKAIFYLLKGTIGVTHELMFRADFNWHRWLSTSSESSGLGSS